MINRIIYKKNKKNPSIWSSLIKISYGWVTRIRRDAELDTAELNKNKKKREIITLAKEPRAQDK